ncbi:arylsulfatase [Phyllobacterium myrsinacearum]|uniref:Arylsulfatase n=1 Tax=Phyllobacterium myrsinacearum TaxID=28101 RepID=A0A839EU75_9HYPH|nr:arylsulfatase [Phyllobacterium myrsinacearum]MBA8880896.1 arylsulfatase [Phyllobacterium myrsinacearum]
MKKPLNTHLGALWLGVSTSLLLLGSPVLAQESLPFPSTPSGSKAGPTIAESTYSPLPAQSHLPANAPNILVIMLDDVGPALPSTFGGVINTSTLSRLADDGISYNRFHNASVCSPTRAALLTGRNPHRVGFGQIAELANDWDGYSGRIPRTSATVAKVLGDYGYATAAFGKWHNTPANETTAVGPYTNWPAGQGIGFDYFYGFLAGESSQWEPAVVENTVRVNPSEGKKEYHFTEDMTDKAVSWMKQERALTPDRPFFMYWTPGASHGPHHIFKQWADKYKGKFDGGWDAMRRDIFARQKKLGWIPASTQLTPRPSTLAAWNDIPEDEKPFQRRLMEVFAGYTEHADAQAGRLIDALDELGIRDNTLIFYVWGDNGSSAEGQNGTVSELLAQGGIASEVKDHIRTMNELGGLDVLGSPKADNMYHAGWAWAGATPYKSTKLIAAHFGGTRTPLVVSWPSRIKPDKTPHPQFHDVNDIVPTIYDVLNIQPPKLVDGITQDPLDGTSMTYSFDTPAAPDQKKEQYFEFMGSRAMYKDGWIASVFGPRIPWQTGIDPSIAKWSPDKDVWELYDLKNDFSQANDVAAAHPEKVEELKQAFAVAAQDNKVYPVGGGLWSVVFHPEDAPSNPAKEFHYTQDVVGVPEFTAPRLGARSNLVTIDAELQPDSKGVLYALGAFSGGVSLWVENGKLSYEYNLFEIERTRIETSTPLPTGKVKIEVETRATGGARSAFDIVIRVDGKEVTKGRVPRSAALPFTANDAFDVGQDSYSPVSLAYFERKPFAFNGKINRLKVVYLN